MATNTFTFGAVVTQLTPAPGNYARYIEPYPPKSANKGDSIQTGYSTIPQTARGYIQGTSIAISNAQIFHVCDPKGIVAVEIARLNSTVASAIQSARNAIVDTILSDSLLGPVYTLAKDLIKDALSALKFINKVLYKLNKTIQEVNSFILYANGFINLIKTLPAKIAQTLQQCLALLKRALKIALTVNLGDIGSLIQQTTIAISQTKTAVSGIKSTGQNLNNLAKNISSIPSSLATNSKQAASVLSASVKSFSSTTNSLVSVTATGSGNPNPSAGYGKP